MQYLRGLPGLSHNDIMQQLKDAYGCCNLPSLTGESPGMRSLAAGDDNPVTDLINQLIKEIFGDKGIPETIDKNITSYFTERLWQGIAKGYGSNIVNVDYNTPDYDMLASLQRDVVHFSAAKDYSMRRAMANELIDDDGKLRTYTEFRNAAFEIANEHTVHHLQAEYDLSVNAAQMSAKWKRILEDIDTFPLLQFDAVIDNHTTKICFSLNGVVRPVDDPFWGEYYPPNHFGCRSTVRQLDDGDITPSGDIVYPDKVPPMFKINLAKKGLAYPPDHPYYNGLPESYGELKLLRTEVLRSAKDKYAGKTIDVDEIGNVNITWQGMKEMGNQPHVDKIKQLQLIQLLPQLMKNAEFISSSPDIKNDGRYKAFHHFSIKGLDDMYLVVRENWAGEKIAYSIVDKLK